MTTSPPPTPAPEGNVDLIWGAAIDSVFGARITPHAECLASGRAAFGPHSEAERAGKEVDRNSDKNRMTALADTMQARFKIMAKFGTEKRPIIVRVQTDERAKYVADLCEENGW